MSQLTIPRTTDIATADAQRVGCVGFMSPETYREQPCTAAVDVFSLGVMLHVLLRHVRRHNSRASVIAQALTAEIDAPVAHPPQSLIARLEATPSLPCTCPTCPVGSPLTSAYLHTRPGSAPRRRRSRRCSGSARRAATSPSS